jgi:hypothetical protein
VGGDGDGGGGRVLGHRQFARYYRQKYRAGDPRNSVAINRVLAQCVPYMASIILMKAAVSPAMCL